MSLENVCTYCGVVCDSVDHVVPRHLLQRAGELGLDLSKVVRIREWEVPACHECNSSIGGKIFATLAERRACAHDHIRRKYASYLCTPNWSESELREMGTVLRRDVEAGIRLRDWARKRLAWAGAQQVEDISAVYGMSQEIARLTRLRQTRGKKVIAAQKIAMAA